MTDIHMVEVDNDNVLFRVVWLHFICAEDNHKVVEGVKYVLDFHVVIDFVDSKNYHWSIVFTVSIRVYEPFS